MNEPLSNLAAVVLVLLLLITTVIPVHAGQGDSSLQNRFQDLGDAPTPPASGDDVAVQEEQQVLVVSQLPVITVWYENTYKFGWIGNPQTQVNILGNVSDPDGSISKVTYSLNNTAPVQIPIGPNSTRLANAGDFNVAIDRTKLLNGGNSVKITAIDNSGGIQSKTVFFNYYPGNTWPAHYNTDWANAANISDQAQVVDGLWTIEAGGVKPVQVGYDRVIAIGNIDWTNYEILVPITVKMFYPNPVDPGDAGGVGVIARWQGHGNVGVLPDDWTKIGAYGYYSNRIGALALRLDGSRVLQQSFPFQYNKTYLFKLRAETVNQAGRYSLKVWEQGLPEPSWSDSRYSNIVNVTDTSDILQGSALLVAHRVDATFGDVTICPPGVIYNLNASASTGGKVTIFPDKSTYQCGEGVTVTATPDAGWQFAGWSGTMINTNPSLSFNMVKNYTLTASFINPINQKYHTYLPAIKR